jgi:hypothetical protein
MCNPAVAMAVVGGLQSGVQFAGARQQAKQQAAAQAQQAAFQAQSIAAAQKKAGFQRTSELLESQQKQLALAQESSKITKKARETLASATVAAGEAGVSGLSVQSLMDDYVRQQAGLQAAVTTQQKLYGLQTGMSLQQIGLASEQEVLGLSQPIGPPVSRPSILGAVLQGTSQAMSGYAAGQGISSRMGSPKTKVS